MSSGGGATPALPAAPKEIDPAVAQAKAESKARLDAVKAMRQSAKRRATSGTILAGNLNKDATLGTATLLGS